MKRIAMLSILIITQILINYTESAETTFKVQSVEFPLVCFPLTSSYKFTIKVKITYGANIAANKYISDIKLTDTSITTNCSLPEVTSSTDSTQELTINCTVQSEGTLNSEVKLDTTTITVADSYIIDFSSINSDSNIVKEPVYTIASDYQDQKINKNKDADDNNHYNFKVTFNEDVHKLAPSIYLEKVYWGYTCSADKKSPKNMNCVVKDQDCIDGGDTYAIKFSECGREDSSKTTGKTLIVKKSEYIWINYLFLITLSLLLF